jgi:hypothetical protein
MVNYYKGEGREAWVSWLGYALYLAMIPFAIAGFVALRRRRIPIWPFVMQFVIVVITAAAFYGITRFRIPVEIVLVVLTAVTIDALLGRSWPRRVDRAEAGAH